MKTTIILFLGLYLSGCSLLDGSASKTQQAYYAPIIQSDKSGSSASNSQNTRFTPVQISDQDLRKQDPYSPVILP